MRSSEDEGNYGTGGRPSFGSCSVIRAGDLFRSVLIDAGADVLFKPGDVLRDLFVSHGAFQRLLQLLHVVGGKIYRRHGDVGDAEHDPFAAARAGGLSDTVLRGTERRGDRA